MEAVKEFVPKFDHRLREVRDFRKKMQRVPLRIVVEGTRGKSSTTMMVAEMLRGLGRKTLAKVTGENPIIIAGGIVMPLYRFHDSVLIDYETVPGINTFEFDSLVFENQAISPYTMQYFHKVIDPTHVLIPNIRLDHLESLGSDLVEITENFCHNYYVHKSKVEVYYIEPIKKVHDVVFPLLRETAEDLPHIVTLHDVPVPPRYYNLPGAENILLSTYFIRQNFGVSIDETKYMQRLEHNLTIRKGKDGIRYANLAKVNDPSSFLAMMHYFFGGTTDEIVLVGYFRKDRAGRNQLFEMIFPEIERLYGNRIRKIWLAGHASKHAFKKLSPETKNKTYYWVDRESIDSILAYAKKHNLVIVTMVNRVTNFMDELYEKMGG